MIIHAGEGYDINAIKNIKYILQKKYTRISHGFHLLNNKFKLNKPIYLEICPISNMLLKFYKIEKHPARNFIHSNNIIISISSDDPGAFGYMDVSKDWFEIYTKWNLNNNDLYKLALNSLQSIEHSSHVNDLCIIFKLFYNIWYDEWLNSL
jgi:adenosine deaminase